MGSATPTETEVLGTGVIGVAGPTGVAEGSSLTFTVVEEELTMGAEVASGMATGVVVGVSGTMGVVVETVGGQ